MPKPLLALTVHQPWAWALAGAWKPVENREWPPPSRLFGGYLAIHAGKSYDADAAEDLAEEAEALGLPRPPPPQSEIALGAIVAVARLAGAVQVERSRPEAPLRVLMAKGAVSPERAAALAASPWSCGPFLWVLEEVVAIEPVPCRGFQKIWTVPPPITDVVRERWLAARKAA